MKAFKLVDGKFSPAQWEAFGKLMDELEEAGNMWEVVIRKPQRTPKQNNMIHAVFQEISDQLEINGLEVKLEVPTSPVALKEYFKAKYTGKPTSMCTTKELSNAFDRFLRHFNKSFANSGLPSINIDNEEFKSLMKSQYESRP